MPIDHGTLFTPTLYNVKLMLYYSAEDPAAWERSVPDVARERPAAA